MCKVLGKLDLKTFTGYKLVSVARDKKSGKLRYFSISTGQEYFEGKKVDKRPPKRMFTGYGPDSITIYNLIRFPGEYCPFFSETMFKKHLTGVYRHNPSEEGSELPFHEGVGYNTVHTIFVKISIRMSDRRHYLYKGLYAHKPIVLGNYIEDIKPQVSQDVIERIQLI